MGSTSFACCLRRFGVAVSWLVSFAWLSGCVSQPAALHAPAKPSGGVALFSLAPLGAPDAQVWQKWVISRFNRPTDYRVVEQDGKRVLEAKSDKSATGILQETAIDVAATPVLRWTWRAGTVLPNADLTRPGTDDSPVRLIVSFDGDHEKLDFEDRAMARMVKLMSGREMPYASIMYVWDNKLPAESVLENPHSGRVRMLVVESGAAGAAQWLSYQRNLIEDYRRAFGEEPGRVISVGVMTDTNRTESSVVSHYGDISLSSK
jgi:hypothetical protein